MAKINFFDYIKNDAFFKPFASKYRRVYYDCMEILIERMKERPVLYESDARDAILTYFKNRKMEPEPGEEQELAPSDMIALFRECGWLSSREIGRNGEYVVNIDADCRRLMDFLSRLAERRTDGAMSNRIFSMYEIMKSLTEEDAVRKERPFSNILVPLSENMEEFRGELSDLKDSISEIMKSVIALQDMNSFGQFIMKDLMLERFFNEYFFIKNNGLIPTQLSFIRGGVRRLKEDAMRLRMVHECAEMRELSDDDAGYLVDKRLSELQYFLGVEYEEHMELIDRRINAYYNLANTRISLMASSGLRLDASISDLLELLSEMENTEKEAALEKISDCIRITRQQFVGPKSFEKRKTFRRAAGADVLEQEALSAEEVGMLTEALFTHAPNRYAVTRADQFLDALMENSDRMETKQHPPRSREEAMMYAATMMYAGNREFPYQVEVQDGLVQSEVADLSSMVITRLKKGGGRKGKR